METDVGLEETNLAWLPFAPQINRTVLDNQFERGEGTSRAFDV